MAPYTTPLDPLLKQIRTLHLLPSASPTSQINCTTSTVSLLDFPSYEALSYVWGDASIQETITFNGNPFPVTKNLFIALQHLRISDQIRTLWVDALCINQSDVKERNEQVAMMGEIYVAARPVVVFLGAGDEESDEGLEMISMAGEETEIDDDVSRKLFGFYLDLMEREWFTRLWTVQELVLACQDPLIGCGLKWTTWNTLVGVWKRIAMKEFEDMGMVIESSSHETQWENGKVGGVNPNGIKIDLLNNLRTAVTTRGGEELRDLLLNTASSNATDPKDRIYGLLGMMQKDDREFFTVDYNRPLGAVYAEAFAHIFEKGVGPFLLSGMELAGPSPSNSFPSWVPNLGSKTLLTPSLFHPPGVGVSGAGSDAKNGAVHEDLKTLRVRGMHVDIILDKISFGLGEECLTQLTQVEALVAKARELANSNCENRAYLRALKTKEPVWRTLIANKEYSGAARRIAPSKYGAMYEAIRTKQDEEDSEEDFTRDYKLALLNHLPGGTFFITETGFYGIGQETLETGDHLVIWFGAPAPFVLNPNTKPEDIGAGEQTYSVRGMAYVAGIMDGEIVDDVYCEELEDDVTFVVV